MTSLASKFALSAQVSFVVGMLILFIGFVKLISFGGHSNSQVIERHMPFAWGFIVTTAASIILAIVATVMNSRAKQK
ncbi:MAG: hypothetical protein IPL96_11350 [Holophagaceae bacterium]|nr:hypothetical protein [Holophagaceae bacterium]